MSRNFTVQKGDFKFSTDDDAHSLARLEKQYESRVAHLKGKHSSDLLRKYESSDTTDEAKQAVVEKVVDCYLAPAPHDKLFGKDIVFFNGKGKPTVLQRADFDEVLTLGSAFLFLQELRNVWKHFASCRIFQRTTKPP